MSKRFAIMCMAVLPILAIGCATTPESIKQVSAVELQMQDNVKRNFDRVLETYDDEMRMWQGKAFSMHITNMESRLVDAEGKVVLEAYKKALNEVTVQYAANEARYDKNLEDVKSAMGDKFAKMRYLAMLINEFENSTGMSPETVEAFSNEIANTTAAVGEMYKVYMEKKAAEEAAKPPSMKDKLKLLGGDVFDKIYERVQTDLDNLTLPPIGDLIGTPVPGAPE